MRAREMQACAVTDRSGSLGLQIRTRGTA